MSNRVCRKPRRRVDIDTVLSLLVFVLSIAIIVTSVRGLFTTERPKEEPAPEVEVLEIAEPQIEELQVEEPQIEGPQEEPEPTPEPDYSLEAEYIAKTVWGEARGCSVDEQEQVIWCILNRVDSDYRYFPDDVISVVTQPHQFHGYVPSNPVWPELYELSLDVLSRWEAEKRGEESNRNLPLEYLYFSGDGKHNTFRVEY